MRRTVRWLAFLVVASCAVLSVNADGDAHVARRTPYVHARDLIPIPTSSPSASASSATDTAKSDTSTSAASSTTPQSSSSTASSTTPSASPSGSSTTPSNTASSGASSSTPPPDSASNSQGGGTSTVVVPGSNTASSAAPTSTSNSGGGGGDNSSISKGSIIGLSVAGGVAVVGIISFFIWKFTRKRFSDFDDSEAIKWPELNAHGDDVHALPTNSTGRAGFGAENDSDFNLARAPSPSVGGGGYAHSVAASSAPDVYHQDPYAVPPLPHLNPNQPQPYRDDPAMYGQPGFYDPYRGPVPNTFGDGMSDGHGHGMEAIPMTQMARTRSPGPQMMYDMQGRASPAPQAGMAMGVPAAYAMGRASPAPPQSPYAYGPR